MRRQLFPFQHNPFFGGIPLAVIVFFLLICGSAWAFTHTDPLPTRLAVIPMAGEISTNGIAVQQGGYAYALNETTKSIGVFNGEEFTALMRLDPPDGTIALPNDLVVHPETGLLYVADPLQGIHVISGTEIITTIRSLDAERKFDIVTVHPKTGYIYAGGIIKESDTRAAWSAVRVISGTVVLADLTLGRGGTYVITPDPRNQRLYVGGTLFPDRPPSWQLSVIEGTNLVMTSTLDYNLASMDNGKQIYDIAVNLHNDELILWEGAWITFWDRVTGEVERVHVRKDYPPISGMGWDPKREILYLGMQDSPFALALRKGRAPQELRIVAGSRSILYDATHDYIYTADYNGPSLSVIRGTQVLATLPTGGRGPWDVGVDEVRGYVYVSNANQNSVTVYGYEHEPSSRWKTFLPWIAR